MAKKHQKTDARRSCGILWDLVGSCGILWLGSCGILWDLKSWNFLSEKLRYHKIPQDATTRKKKLKPKKKEKSLLQEIPQDFVQHSVSCGKFFNFIWPLSPVKILWDLVGSCGYKNLVGSCGILWDLVRFLAIVRTWYWMVATSVFTYCEMIWGKIYFLLSCTLRRWFLGDFSCDWYLAATPVHRSGAGHCICIQ